jgi:hypothetical protein
MLTPCCFGGRPLFRWRLLRLDCGVDEHETGSWNRISLSPQMEIKRTALISLPRRVKLEAGLRGLKVNGSLIDIRNGEGHRRIQRTSVAVAEVDRRTNLTQWGRAVVREIQVNHTMNRFRLSNRISNVNFSSPLKRAWLTDRNGVGWHLTRRLIHCEGRQWKDDRRKNNRRGYLHANSLPATSNARRVRTGARYWQWK